MRRKLPRIPESYFGKKKQYNKKNNVLSYSRVKVIYFYNRKKNQWKNKTFQHPWTSVGSHTLYVRKTHVMLKFSCWGWTDAVFFWTLNNFWAILDTLLYTIRTLCTIYVKSNKLKAEMTEFIYYIMFKPVS